MAAPPNVAEPPPPTEFAALVAAGRMQAACDLALTLPRHAIDQHMLRMLMNASLAADHARARHLAIGLAVEMRLAHGVRAVIVQRLADAGLDEEAQAVILADPGFPNAPQHAKQKVVNAYVSLARAVRTPLQRQAIHAAIRRMLNRAPMPAERSPLQLPQMAASAEFLAPHPLVLIPAGPDAERDADQFREQASAFETQLRAPTAQAILLHDVYVSRSGEIWDAQGRLLRDNWRILPPERRDAMADAPVIDEAVDALDGTRNFFHWMTETLPSLAFAALPGAPDWPVLLAEDAPGFAAASLAMVAPALAARVRPVGEVAFVRRLHLGSRRASDLRFWGAYDHLFGPMIAHADALPPGPDDSDLLYISRRDSALRPMLNEAVLEAALARLGFSAVTLSSLSLAEQISRVRRARMIVAPHGAGLAHLLLARPGTQVLEITNSRDGFHHLTFGMARLSRLRGHRHTIWLQHGHPTVAAWSVRVPAIVAAARAMLG